MFVALPHDAPSPRRWDWGWGWGTYGACVGHVWAVLYRYFMTGDVAAWSKSDQSYMIKGRASVDIIKSGGHKVGNETHIPACFDPAR